MKKILLFTSALILGISTIQAQNSFYIGAHAGLPVNDGASNYTSFALTADVGYLFDISEDFKIGPTLGYSHTFGKDIDMGVLFAETDDIQFMPIAAASRFNISDKFTVGADVGFAIGINEENDGGFYYSPRAAYSLSKTIDAVLSYRGISGDSGNWNIISVGVEFSFN
ncbi:outer membrane beta-barrel protein [Flagellimonas marina]|uniref:Outer membrane beta-barrel protein n=1 Tax=Flagellimonas marina TaxID=1775168 RepID=A0ABV8PLJ8_9FLAO